METGHTGLNAPDYADDYKTTDEILEENNNKTVDEETDDSALLTEENAKLNDLLSSEINKDNSGDDDLEIPAFLRRQKN